MKQLCKDFLIFCNLRKPAPVSNLQRTLNRINELTEEGIYLQWERAKFRARERSREIELNELQIMLQEVWGIKHDS